MIKIVVDSSSDIDEKEAVERGLVMLPMQINFGEEEYLDGVNITKRQFFEKLIESEQLPKTSQINEFSFDECFAKLVGEGDEVLAITLSSKLSGTFNSARQAAKKYGEKVYVVDSLNATIGERILVELALRLVGEGKSLKEIATILEEKKTKIKLMAVLGTLKYLKKGGRISPLVAFAGELLSIKPVVEVVKGEVKLVGKAMGSKKGNTLLNQMVEKSGGIDFDLPCALAYSGLSDEFLKKYVEDSKLLYEGHAEAVRSFLIGSTIGTHVGPGAIAVAFFAKS